MSNQTRSGEVVLSALLLLLTCSSLPATFHQTGRKEEAILGSKARPLDSQYQTPRGLLMACLSGAGVAGGIVEQFGCEAQPPVQIGLLPSVTVREALDLIAEIDPNSRWEISDGAINVLPMSGEPELLKVRLKRVNITNVRSLTAAVDVLWDLPEVREVRQRLQLRSGVRFYVGGYSLSGDVKAYTIKCMDVTFREALNAIVLAHGRAGWAYTERHCNGERTVTVDIIVE